MGEQKKSGFRTIFGSGLPEVVVTTCGRELHLDTVKLGQEDAMVEEGVRQTTSLSRTRMDNF